MEGHHMALLCKDTNYISNSIEVRILEIIMGYILNVN